MPLLDLRFCYARLCFNVREAIVKIPLPICRVVFHSSCFPPQYVCTAAIKPFRWRYSVSIRTPHISINFYTVRSKRRKQYAFRQIQDFIINVTVNDFVNNIEYRRWYPVKLLQLTAVRISFYCACRNPSNYLPTYASAIGYA